MEVNKINLRTVPVVIGGETLNVKRKAVTFEDWRKISERQKVYRESVEKAEKLKTKDAPQAEPDNYPLVQNLCQIVVDLDLTSDGKPLPVTPETLLALDVAALVAIHDAVLEDANPNPAKP